MTGAQRDRPRPVGVRVPSTGSQFLLERDGQRAVVTEVGATLRAWRVDEREQLDSFEVDEVRDGFHGKVLLPWPNRIRDSRYVFGGTEHRVAISEPELGNALHGLVLWANWHPLRHSSDELALGYMLHPQPGYPFTLELEVAYRLTDDGLAVTLKATNRGDRPAPFGAGFHPYLVAARGDARLELPARTRVPVDERMLPAGAAVPVEGTEYDFRRLRPLGELALDTCFGDLERGADGLARATLAGGRAVSPLDGRALPLHPRPHDAHRHRARADDVRAGRVQLGRRSPDACARSLVRRPLGSQHTTGGAVMRRSSRATNRVVGAVIAVVALAVAGPGSAVAKPRHGARHGHGHHGGSLSIKKEAFGAVEGTAVDRYTLANRSMSVSILTYGGIIQELWAPDRRGRRANITLGYKDLEGYPLRRGDSARPAEPLVLRRHHRPLRQPHRQRRVLARRRRRTRWTSTTTPTASTAVTRASTASSGTPRRSRSAGGSASR